MRCLGKGVTVLLEKEKIEEDEIKVLMGRRIM
jgi:hypothetical protein